MTSATLDGPERFSIGRVFNNTFSVISRNIVLCLGMAALFSGLPALVLQLWTQSVATKIALGAPNAAPDPSMMFSGFSVTFGVGLISFVLALLLQSALVRATIEDMNGKQPSFGDCLQIAVRYLLPTLGVGLLVALGAGLGALLLFVPGVILWLGWCVAVPVLIQERLGVLGSMSRSRVLTKGNRWPLFGLFVVLFLAVMAIQMVLGTITLLLGGIVGAVGAALVSTASSMLLSIATAATYVELRQVREGTSVEELAEIFA